MRTRVGPMTIIMISNRAWSHKEYGKSLVAGVRTWAPQILELLVYSRQIHQFSNIQTHAVFGIDFLVVQSIFIA